MKPIRNAILFLLILTALDVLLRKGFIAFLIPFSLPYNLNGLLLFSLFAGAALWLTQRFARFQQANLSQLGISWNKANRIEFVWGFVAGVVPWGLVAVSQAWWAGFTWEFRPNFNALTLLYGLLFIFIADLGTEVYTRGYAITQFKNQWNVPIAIGIMVLFEIIKSVAFNWGSSAGWYAIVIPVLHIVFFSFIYFTTQRLGASLGMHTGANFVTISLFDLRPGQPHALIPSGLLQADTELEALSIHALQLPWVIMAVLVCLATFMWWKKSNASHT
jgi:hypothetical protein